MGIPATIGQYLSINLTYTEPQTIILNNPGDPGLADVCSRGNQPVLTINVYGSGPYGSPILGIQGWVAVNQNPNGQVGWKKFNMTTPGFNWTWTPSGVNGLGGASYCYYSLSDNAGQIACRTYFYFTDIAQPNPNTNLPIDIRVDYSLDSTIYYNTATTNTFYPENGGNRGYVMPDFSDWPGITFPDSLNNTVLKSGGNFSTDVIVEPGSYVQMGIANETYTVDTIQSTLGGFGLFGATSVTTDIAQAASGESLVLVFGNAGDISSDISQTQTVKVIQDLIGQDTLVSLADILPTALLNIVTGNQSLVSEFDITPLMGLARYGAALFEGDGFLMSDSFVIRLDDYWLVKLAPESRIINTGPENRFPLVEPETRNNKTLAEYKYYLVEPETRTYKISANPAEQIGRRTRRLEQ